MRCDLLKCSFKDILFAVRIDFKQFLHTGYISGQLDIFGHLQIIFSLRSWGSKTALLALTALLRFSVELDILIRNRD